MASLIRVENIKRTFTAGNEKIQALKGISLEIQAGELTAVTGPSGSGKTTLVNIIGGLDKADEGAVFYKGLNLGRLPDAQLTDLRSREIGFVFQSFALVDILTVYENIELPLRVLKINYRERRKRVRECLELVGLEKRSQHRAYELSGGEQQRVGIARAIVTNPALILADEPTGELNQEVAQVILELFEQIVKEFHKTIIIVSHDPLVVEFVNRSFHLVDGKLTDKQGGALSNYTDTE